MRKFLSKSASPNLREKLIEVIEASDEDLVGKLKDETSLIKSGMLDSLALFNVALFIERQIGYKVDITAFDPAKEWDTIAHILKFISKLRASE
jgi:acyl carrier protein